MSRRWEWTAITLILLLAAALRLWRLGEVPPGLAHDEVANWLIARDILSGDLAIYFTAAYGHEPLYQYVQAATVALFGDHWLGLRWPSVALGLLGIAVTHTLMRRLFGASVALLTAAWLAVSFWPLFYARVGLRAIALPFTAALTAYFLLRAVGLPAAPSARSRLADWLLGGLFLGLSLYTYMAARIFPFIVAAFLLYLFLVRSTRPVPWSRILVFFLVAALVSAPLVMWLVTHSGAESRIAEVREPLDRLLAGDPSLAWRNLIANLGSFTFAGDPWPRQNLPGRQVFTDVVSAACFTAGVLIALWRWREPRHGFALIWLVGSLGPSVVTAGAPSSIRDILGLVIVFVFPALALVEASRWVRRISIPYSLLPTPYFLLLASCFLLPSFLLTVRDYFSVWPQHDVVRFDYQADLTAVARRIDELPVGTPVAVAGLSVHTMDRPSLDLASRRDVRDVRLCDTRETLVVPAGRESWLFVPQVVPVDEDLEARLAAWGAAPASGPRGLFDSYRLPDTAAVRREWQRLEAEAALPDGSPLALPASFDGRLSFLGYEWLTLSPVAGDSLDLLTYWRVDHPPSTPLKVFVHLIEGTSSPITQHDGLGSPPDGWAEGDLIVQKHVLPLPADLSPGLYKVVLGVYNPPAGSRLAVAGADHVLLPPIEVLVPSR